MMETNYVDCNQNLNNTPIENNESLNVTDTGATIYYYLDN